MTAFPGQWCIPGRWDTSGASISRAAQPMTHSREDGTGGHWLLPIFWAARDSPAHLIVAADKPQQLTSFFPIHFATISSCGHRSQFLHSGRATLDCAVNPLVWQVQANPKHPCSSSLAGCPQAKSGATGSRTWTTSGCAVALYPAAPSASQVCSHSPALRGQISALTALGSPLSSAYTPCSWPASPPPSPTLTCCLSNIFPLRQ